MGKGWGEGGGPGVCQWQIHCISRYKLNAESHEDSLLLDLTVTVGHFQPPWTGMQLTCFPVLSWKEECGAPSSRCPSRSPQHSSIRSLSRDPTDTYSTFVPETVHSGLQS